MDRIPVVFAVTVSILVLAVFGMQSIAASGTAPSGAAIQIQGDVDCDSDVDSIDSLQILKFVASIGPFAGCLNAGGDIDCDGKHDSTEALRILRFLAGLPTLPVPDDCTPIGEQIPVPPQENAYMLGDPLENVSLPDMTDLAVNPVSPEEAIVVTHGGGIYRISLVDAFMPIKLGDIAHLMGNLDGDEGLVSVAFEPGDGGYIYLSYTAGTQYYQPARKPASAIPPDPKRSVISRFAVDEDEVFLDSEEIIIEVLEPGFWHNVNDIVFDSNGYLYAGAGDGGGLDAEYDGDSGQGVTNLLATVFRIDPNPPGSPGYEIPPGNPFDDGDGPNADEAWAYGFRNPWRLSFDGDRLWVGDVGEFYWEEINEVLPGMNYGWNTIEGEFGNPLGYFCNQSPCLAPPANYQEPRASYCHHFVAGCPYPDPLTADTAVIGGYVYRGSDLPDLEGWYVYGDLGTVRLRAFDTNDEESEPVIIAEDTVAPCRNCLRSFAQLPDGEILAVLSAYDGSLNGIYRLISADEATPTPSATATPSPSPGPTPTPTPVP